MQKSLSCAIIGAGSIGGLIDSPNSTNIASHAHAFLKHPNCTLVAICEPNSANQSAFIGRWGEMGIYHSLDALLQYETIDLLAIASPTQFHANALVEALHVKSLQAILCEKPLVATAKELAHIAPMLLSSEKKVLIHLMRRYDPSFITLANAIATQKWGKAVRFQGVFTKGLLHNGVHMLAVLSHFFGEIQSLKSLHVKHLHEDIGGDFEVTCKDARGVLSCMEELPYSAFELTVWFENGKVEIKEGGSRIESFIKVPSPLYEGYFSLEHEETLPNTLKDYALHSLEFLLQNDDLICKQILQEQINVHAKIFETIEKEKQR